MSETLKMPCGCVFKLRIAGDLEGFLHYACPKHEMTPVAKKGLVGEDRKPPELNQEDVGPHLACVGCGELFEQGEPATMEGSSHYHPNCAPAVCFTCGSTMVATKFASYCPKCLAAEAPKGEPPKVGGNYRGPDIDKWFGLHKPTEDEAALMDAVRAVYISVAKGVLEFCPSNPDRTAAIRQLKESMHTAITSIVCADAWEG